VAAVAAAMAAQAVAVAVVEVAAASSSTLAPARLVAQARLCKRLRVTSGW
jgi:hypothetical protein